MKNKTNDKDRAEKLYFLLELLSVEYSVTLASTKDEWICRVINTRKGVDLACRADMAYKAVIAAHEASQRLRQRAEYRRRRQNAALPPLAEAKTTFEGK